MPQYSPLRYPGGKTWLYPFAKRWLKAEKSKLLIEPFAGGASVGLAAAIEGWVEKVILVEKDENIASLWQTIISGDGPWLARQIVEFDFTEENINRVLEKSNESIRDRAFAVMLHNRINRGGILAQGAGRVKHGENGKGLISRWYPKTLAERILRISQYRDRLQIIQGDGLEVIMTSTGDEKVAFFIDPPYTVAGKRLYTYSDIDHEKLFLLMKEVRGTFLMTYDDTEEIREYARKHGFEYEKILMKTTHHIKKYELLISTNLSWLYK
ncbi:MAG: DNA adenine methylase [Calditrichaeota bacterium]|nr:MAG: DNA adenine methylase [Calditrichota bacterium]